ncbi:DNA-directed DNA polymerase [Senna tora]|uniref:DNA-directed DNA polymerase n=1 Tax=Senna tora TaxID=362788 RepID=A0A834THH5_9FABA|nr:DNA-directed DNA polymerase [Senna tora]
MFASLSSQIAALTKEVKSLGIQGAVKAVSPFVQPCENCGESHTSEQCPLVLESVQYLANRNANNPYFNTYNSGWRNHPNFSWSQNQGTGPSSSAAHPNYPHGPPPPVEKKPSLEDMMMSYMSKNDALMQSQNAVDKLILLADFIVLDYEEDKNVPIILGRPFLATGRTIIDVQKGELTMRVQDQEVKFKVFKAMKLPEETEECFHVKVVDNMVDCSVQDDELKYHPIDPSEVFKYLYAGTCDVDFIGCAKILEAPTWKIRAPPWCHKPSQSYSMEQDWIFVLGLQDNIVHESAITWNFCNATPTPFSPIDPG